MSLPLTIERVTKSFGSLRPVDDVSVAIEAGELFFLLGPSGCGKTTLLRCVAGFYEPDAGHIRLGERDITRIPPHRRDTAMVFQSYALWPHMTVWENVAFGLEMRRIAREDIRRRVAEVLRMVRMEDRARHKPNQLSGGQQQRVALARALVIRPQCLLLDEPLSNLDAKLRLEMRQEIRRICKEAGLTALYVTHDQKEALSVADRLAVMKDGKIVQIGDPLEVYRHPTNTFVAQFVGETNFLPARMVGRGPGTVRLRTAVGELVSSRATEAREGDAVTVSVRPESIRLHAPPADAVNVLRGRLHHTVYLGEVAQHCLTVAAADGSGSEVTLKASEMNASLVARDHEETVLAWLHPDDLVILEALR